MIKKITTIHYLKIQDKWMERVLSGEKNSELRYNDRDFQVGDLIVLTRISGEVPSTSKFEITHVLTSDACDGLEDGYCILSLAPAKRDADSDVIKS